MIDTNSLRGIIAAKGYSQRKLAKLMGISEKTFYEKMKKGVFVSTEIEFMMELLEIENPKEIFFAQNVV